MNDNSLKRKTASAFVWAYGEKIAAQIVSLIVSVALARVLTPNEYGIVAIVTVFIAFADIFVTAGAGTSLIQNKEADELDFNTAFVYSITVSFLLYLVLFFAAPYIAVFYRIEILALVVRVMGLRLFIAAINTIQHAFIQKKLEFKKFFFSTLVGTIISAFLGIYMAYSGYGVWALVLQYLSNSVIDTVMLFFVGDWFPKLQFSFARFKIIFSFSWKIFVHQMTYTLTNNVQSLVIGKSFSAADLAFYNNGSKIPNVVLSNIYSTLGNVLFPALSTIQDTKERQKEFVRQSIRACVFLLAPMSVGLLVTATPLVSLVYTDKWLPCVIFLQIYCLRFLPRPLTTIVQQVIIANGRADIALKMEIFLNFILMSTMCLAVFYFKSVVVVAWGTLVAVLVGVVLNSILVNKLINYTYKEQLFDMIPAYFSAFFMGVLVIMENRFINNAVNLLVTQVFTGIIAYILISMMINKSEFNYVYGFIKNKFLKRNISV